MSGFGAPARTAMATPERTRSTLLPLSTLPSAMSLSMALLASTTTSTASPAATRFATSTPPAASAATDCPVLCSYCPESSDRTSRVAIDEIILRGLLDMERCRSWPQDLRGNSTRFLRRAEREGPARKSVAGSVRTCPHGIRGLHVGTRPHGRPWIHQLFRDGGQLFVDALVSIRILREARRLVDAPE